MTEYYYELVNASNIILPYGKIVRIRIAFAGTWAASKYCVVRVYNSNSTQTKFYHRWSSLEGAAQTSFLVDHSKVFEVNIDIDKNDVLTAAMDFGSGSCYCAIDIIKPVSAKNRQFADNLSGINNSSGGYTT